MLAANQSLGYITELELESIQNYAIKECFEIIQDEVEFFFQSKEYLIDIFIEGIDFSKLSPKYLQERFYKVFYSKKEIDNFLERIERRIHRELIRASIRIDFNLPNSKIMELFNIQESFLFVLEAYRTYALSCNTAKAVNTLWKKSSSSIVPKVLRKLSREFNAGEYFLSTVGLTTKEIKCSISGQVSRRIRGILRNNKHELINLLRNEVVKPIISLESVNHSIISKREIVKTA
jgi:hypothetical protein